MFDEVINSVWEEVNIWDKLEVSWVTSFSSTNRVVEGCLNKDRSSFALGGKGGRSFESAVDERRYAEDELLDEGKSTFDSLGDKEDSSKIVGSFFETNSTLDVSDSMNSFLGTRGKEEALEVE